MKTRLTEMPLGGILNLILSDAGLVGTHKAAKQIVARSNKDLSIILLSIDRTRLLKHPLL